MKNKRIIFVILSTFFLVGCFDPAVEKQQIKNNLIPFYETLLFEDIAETMAYFSPNSPSYFDYYQRFQQDFSQSTLLYEPNGITFDEVSEELISVKVKVFVSGVDANKTHSEYEIIHLIDFKLDAEGKWKIHTLKEIPL